MADLREIKRAARILLDQEGFYAVPFKFVFTTKWFGAATVDEFDDGRINPVSVMMSRPYAVINTFDRCVENLQHEVAHLTTWGRDADQHGPAWKADAMRLGLSLPTSHFDETTTMIPTVRHFFMTRDQTVNSLLRAY